MNARQTVLVVEDDALIREMIQDVLEEEGFHTVGAETTQAAIAAMEQGEAINALFADIDLGDHGGGYEVARCARRLQPGVKVIYTSGGAREDFSRERVEDAVFVQKPYRPSQVCSLLKKRLAG